MWLIPQQSSSTIEERWQWFMEHYTPQMEKALFTEAFRILGSREDAQDVLQEALVRGATRCWQLRNEERLFQWLFSIVRNLSFDLYKQRVRSKWSISQFAARHATSTVSLEDRAMTNEFKTELLQIISTLPYPEIEIIRLKTQTNMNLRQIAEHLHINYHTVRSKYNRIMKRILKTMR